MSIQPQWCELIANGEKTVEVRKTRPKFEAPFKVYIYCTKGKPTLGRCLRDNSLKETPEVDFDNYNRNTLFRANGKVIGEFICDEITEYEGEFWDDETQESIKKVIHSVDWDGYPEVDYIFFAENGEENSLCKSACLTWKNLRDYMGTGINTFYGWHISGLVIYDEPKDLGEFFAACNKPAGTDCTKCTEQHNNSCKQIKRPPQSWCFVEEVSDGNV